MSGVCRSWFVDLLLCYDEVVQVIKSPLSLNGKDFQVAVCPHHVSGSLDLKGCLVTATLANLKFKSGVKSFDLESRLPAALCFYHDSI